MNKMIEITLQAVCEIASLSGEKFTPKDIQSKNRAGSLPYYRHMYCAYLRSKNLTLKEIGGGIKRDHTTIMHSIREHNALIGVSYHPSCLHFNYKHTFERLVRLADSVIETDPEIAAEEMKIRNLPAGEIKDRLISAADKVEKAKEDLMLKQKEYNDSILAFNEIAHELKLLVNNKNKVLLS